MHLSFSKKKKKKLKIIEWYICRDGEMKIILEIISPIHFGEKLYIIPHFKIVVYFHASCESATSYILIVWAFVSNLAIFYTYYKLRKLLYIC